MSERRSLRSRVPAWTLWGAGGLIVVLTGLVFWYLLRPDPPERLRLDQVVGRLEAGRIREATVRGEANELTGVLRDGTRFATSYPPDYEDTITRRLVDSDAKLRVQNDSDTFVNDLITSLLPTLLVIGAFLWFVTQMQGTGKKGFGKARAKRVSPDTTVTFADVAGAEEAVEELREVAQFLSDPKRFAALGAKIPKGVLLFGPPGTGKTLLARAVAGEAGVPFFTISGSDFVEMFVGVGASRVRDLFRQAKEQAPAIVFVDEIDAVGRHRGAGVGGGHDEREQTLNQLLVEMDGFDEGTGVILMAATNRPDILDPALLRPGRFDRHIVVDNPDLRGREAILTIHARGKPLDPEVDLAVVARRTPGFTGADLANVLNEAALLAARRDRTRITPVEIDGAIDRVIAGPERRSLVMNAGERSHTAYHEAGHAIVGHALPDTDPVHRVSIVARGQALGWTLSLPIEDRYTVTESQLRDRMAMMLAGRVAEQLVFDELSTGAADDIVKVTELARSMVTQFGMSAILGPRRYGQSEDEPFLGREHGHRADYSETTSSVIDAEIARLVDEAARRARATLEAHRTELDTLAARLIEVETVEEAELHVMLEGVSEGV